jgi:AraC family transcriptional regulator of adaptative response / DNA-3-methyladenine glycosylase II
VRSCGQPNLCASKSETCQQRVVGSRYTHSVDGFEVTYRAVEARERRLDGRVFVAVTTTGIYCRPVCPVPMPRREYVRFYRAVAAAEEAGFRACRRCRPETSPDSPDWDVRADLVGRGLRLIADGVVDRDGIDGLARRLSVGSRHLHRAFVQELGTGPLAIARSRRAALAKQLLEQTDLPSTAVAFAAGFSSVRSYHDTLRCMYDRTPTEIRVRRRSDDVRSDSPELRLAYRPPFAAERLLGFLRTRAIPGVEHVAGGIYARAMRTPDGSPVVIELEPYPGAPVVGMRVTGVGDDVPLLASVVRAARRLFDLDADPEAIDATLAGDAPMRGLVSATPGTRLPGATDGFELAVRAIVGQQVSVAGARTTLARIAERFGEPLVAPTVAVERLFPSAERLAEAPRDSFSMPGARAGAILAVAQAVATGELDLSGSAELEPTLEAFRSIRGVGEWTASYVAMRALRDPDAFPAGDLGVRHGFRALGLPDDAGSIRARAERWRPWRAYAAMHLWHAEG